MTYPHQQTQLFVSDPPPQPTCQSGEETGLVNDSLGHRYARVLVQVNTRTLQDRLFTYKIPAEYADIAQVGQPVTVPFGGQPELMGFITELLDELPEEDRHLRTIRELNEIADETPLFDADYYRFIAWVADYCATPVVQVLACALPGALLKKMGKRVYPGPAMLDSASWNGLLAELSQAQPMSSKQKSNPRARLSAAKALRESLYSNGRNNVKRNEGYRPRFLANRLGMNLKTMNQLLAWLKNRGAVVLETDWSQQASAKTIKTVFAVTRPKEAQLLEQAISTDSSNKAGQLPYSDSTQNPASNTSIDSALVPSPLAGEGQGGGWTQPGAVQGDLHPSNSGSPPTLALPRKGGGDKSLVSDEKTDGAKAALADPIEREFIPTVSLTPRQKTIIESLYGYPDGIALSELLDKMGTTLSTVKKLVGTGHLTIRDIQVHRDSLGRLKKLSVGDGFVLSGDQRRALDTVVNGDASSPYLLYGVTGSGKTEVYLSMARAMLERGKATLVMVPEIALTSQIARRFIRYFGAENVAIWHSGLSEGEKADTWRKLQRGELPILIGARSAIWAPMQNLGLILIDEAHEGSFKQDSPEPRYDARILAEELARQRGIQLVLGSATPDLGSFYQAQKDNRILHLSQRFGSKPLATVEVADMNQEKREGNKSPLSRQLKTAIATNLADGGQTIILLNRRGFFTTIQCTACEHVFQCAHCDISLTFHRAKNKVCCHYCGFEGDRPVYCPACASMELNHTGLGTQRLEDEVLKHFPEARVLRLDGDIMQRKNAHLDVFETFSAGEADILIGTQIVAKGLDVANVTLVGVVNADASFALPDFKSAERGFQLITQVAGRAGRGHKAGKVIIQAIQAQHPVLKFAAAQDYPGFYEEEIVHRELLGFPPFSQLFRFIASGEDENKTQQYITAATLHLREALRVQGLEDKVTLMGPAPCVLPRIRDRYRFHLLAKNFAGEAGHKAITAFYKHALNSALPNDINWILDPDTLSLL